MSITLKILADVRQSAMDYLSEETGKSEDELLDVLQEINSALYRAVGDIGRKHGLDVVIEELDGENGPYVRMGGHGPALLTFLSVTDAGNHIHQTPGYRLKEMMYILQDADGPDIEGDDGESIN